MELNIQDFISDNETYYMLRTKNYKKNKCKYPKNKGLLDFYKLYYINSNKNYDKILQDLIKNNIIKDDKLFIITFKFNDDNIVMMYRGVNTINNNFLNKYIDADEKYQKTRFKILPIMKSNSKFLNFLSKDNKPIMMAKKTETKFINKDNYFIISVNLYKNLILRGIINKIKSNSDGFSFNLGFTIETNEKDNLKEELLFDIYVNDLKNIFS